MKIKDTSQRRSEAEETTASPSSEEMNVQDATELFISLQDEYRNVFMHQIENQIFFYRSLGRSEYKKILSDDRFDNMAKEELICQVCTLFPEEYDFEECDAGVPTVLAQAILKNSFLDTIDSRRNVLDFYRQEMFDLDNQITCIINEAFPQFDIEEIESWGIEKTTKYLSRAEWKLHNLRGLQFYDTDAQESYYETQGGAQPQEQTQEVHTEEVGVQPEKEQTNMRGGNKEKLTPEKLRELQQKFPEIDWTGDTIMNEGVEGMADAIDVTSPALRPGF
ncbi:hypothetical protein [Bacillus atrophaeus]|uniref:hypothetical protein n=1 Tax=Bacillus atrophaeus TaxID=1452 RepID=UPI002E1E3902|nr:hypothetical protein [Bacillus atrophaeus]